MAQRSKTTAHTAKSRQAAKRAGGEKPAKAPTAKTRQKRTTTTPRVRTLAQPKRVWYKPFKRRKLPPRKPLPKARHLFVAAIKRLEKSKRAVAGVTAVYGLGVVLLVRGFSASQDFETLRILLDSLLTGATGKLQSIALQLTFLFGGGGNDNSLPNASLYQTILLVVCSLAFIWIFRQKQAKAEVSTKAAFYKGMYPLIPFLLVLLVIGLQLLPLVIGSFIYNILINGGIAVHTWERLLALALFLLAAFWSLRMLTASMFALYIVTLPDMLPLQALRSAKELVRGRRLMIWRKFLLLPVVLFLGTTIVILPFLLFLTPFVVWVFFLLSTVWSAIIHSYLYTLYRELIEHD
ncbi:hypothetical protein CSA80_01165 [Candidatus Saccharibacteria bacterium]|nr:MAG: hypothetical protein CR973_01990 [Candidatus Saccharibacteria bacterium]PID99357.1 MAG: hypothetical protein CSA80_01165 [Candidatus Saccharibacteria bacterium]